MLINYFTTAWRGLFRHKGFTVTNLLGLTVGMTCSILIFLWVQDELSFDTFHRNYKNIYQVYVNRGFKDGVYTDGVIPFPLVKALEKGYPQIEHVAETSGDDNHVLAYGDTKLTKRGYSVSEQFFDVFSWTFVRGNAATAIADPTSIVLTESAAKAFFGDAEAVGKVVRMDNMDNFRVSAVIKDAPGNSSMQFDFVRLFNYSDANLKQAMNDWNSASWNVFVQTKPGAAIAPVTKAINDIMHFHDPASSGLAFFPFPMSRWRLYGEFKDGKNVGGLIEYVRLFSMIAIIILLIACINFMNLSTARSEQRAKEVGVRKTLGSGKGHLVRQFLLESMLLAAMAFGFALGLVLLLLPAFNTLVAKQLVLRSGDPVFWGGMVFIVLFTGLVAGSYPAFYLSSFNPVTVLKGTFVAGRKAILPRRVLVVTQFVVSILLMSATIIVYRQLQYIKNRDLGYDPNNLITVTASAETNKNFVRLKQELLNTGMVEAMTRSYSPVTDIYWRAGPPDWEGKPADVSFIVAGMTTDVDFIKTTGMKLLAGRDFSGTPADSTGMLVNRAAVEAMRLADPLGKQLRFQGNVYTVIGVTGNMVMADPYKPVEPLLMRFIPDASGAVSLRLKKGVAPKQALAAMEPIFRRYNPEFPFDYQFVDQEFGKKFRAEELISKVTDIFAGLAIFICCLGLAGLASFTIERRTREIGIRKVLGATVGQLLGLISVEFLRLVGIAFVIAVPATWWVMSGWLEKYVFHISISPWLFVGVGVLILVLTLVVVGVNTMGAALRNPVKALRRE